MVLTVLIFASSTSMIMFNKWLVNICPSDENPSPRGFIHDTHAAEVRYMIDQLLIINALWVLL